MSSSHKKDLTIISTSKGAGETLTGDTITLPPDCDELLLAVTTDDSVSGVVNAVLEVSADGENWTEAKTATMGLANIPAQIAHGTITYPSTTAAAGTVVCSISYSGGNLDVNPTYVLTLTGDDADQYRLNNVTQTQTGDTLTGVVFGDIVRLEVYNDDNSGGSYAFNYPTTGYYHDDVTIKVVESSNSLEDEVTIDNAADAQEGIWKHAEATLTKSNLVAALDGDSAIGEFVCDLTPGGGPTGSGTPTYSLSLSGTNAGKYRIKNHTIGVTGTAGGSISGIALGNSVKLEVGDTFDYAEATTHDVTITNTESINSMTASTDIDDLTVDATVTYVNEKYWKMPADATSSNTTSFRVMWGEAGGEWFTDKDGNILGGNDAGIFDLQDAWTFSLWLTVDEDLDLSTLVYPAPFIGWSDSSWAVRVQLLINVATQAADTVRYNPTITMYGGSTAGTNSIGSGYFTRDANEWIHIVWSKKATGTSTYATGDLKIHVDGTDVSTGSPSATWGEYSFLNTNNTYYGGMPSLPLYGSPPNDSNNQSIDELAVWNRQLTDAEITAIYNSGTPIDVNSDDVGGSGEDCSRDTGGLIAYYRYGDGTGDDHNTAKDVSGNGNDLEIDDGYTGSSTGMIQDHP